MNTGEELENGQEEGFSQEELDDIRQVFEEIWKDVKQESKDMSKKDLAFEMFLSGIMVERRYIEELNNEEKKEE